MAADEYLAGITEIADGQAESEAMPNLVVITGMSGAGRTEAMHAFEDLGYFCVDNLPANLIENLLSLDGMPGHDGEEHKLAVVIDARNGTYFKRFEETLADLRERQIPFKLFFLDAEDSKLIARYKSSRRRHPLCADGSTITEGIKRERRLLGKLREEADYVIDTTDMLPTKLRSTIRDIFAGDERQQALAVTVYSFGFKHGAPLDADLVMDVRFLPNPFYDPELRPLTGLDSPVRDYVMLRDETIEFNKRWQGLLDVVMPGYVAEGKQQLAIAIGCTGGQHRSVALAEATGDYLKSQGYRVSVAHRDMNLAKKQ